MFAILRTANNNNEKTNQYSESSKIYIVICSLILLIFTAIFQSNSAYAQLALPQSTESAPQETVDQDVIKLFIDVIKDDEKRKAFIESLEAASQPTEGVDGAADTAAKAGAEANLPESFGREIAKYTQELAEATASRLKGFWMQVRAAPSAFAALDASQIGVIIDALKDLALVIVTTYAIFLVLRRLAKGLYRRIGHIASSYDTVKTLGLSIASTLVDAGVVLLAWAGGYAIALVFFGEFGSIAIRQTLYLNAFLIVELIKVVLRFVLSPSTGELRLLPISDAASRAMNRGFTAIITVLGYGQLLVVPIFNQNVSFAAGRAISVLIALAAVGIAIAMTLRHRQKVADWLTTTQEGTLRSNVLKSLAHQWHWFALAYLLFLMSVVIARPAGVLFPILNASFQVAAGFVAGFIVSGWLAGAISRGVALPDELNRRLPLLERRLNAFVPHTLTIVRLLIFVAVVSFALHTIGLVNVTGWMQSQFGVRATTSVLTVMMILVMAFVCWLALSSWVDYRTNPEYGKVPSAREQTLLTLLKNAATIAILVVTLMFSLSEIGINIAPLIASAGVLGLAIGFGAQKLVQDIITGVFIQLENAINVGDVITVAGTTGTVERLTIRSVGLRDLHGSYHIVPFSSVDMVTNFMRDFAYHVCDMGIAYREDHEVAKAAMFDAFEELRADAEIADGIIGDMEWSGVQELGDSAVILRSRIKTKPGKQWAIGRAYNGLLKKVFDERGIEIPFPHQTIYFGEDRQGNAPAAHIVLTRPAQVSHDDQKEPKPEAVEAASGAASS